MNRRSWIIFILLIFLIGFISFEVDSEIVSFLKAFRIPLLTNIMKILSSYLFLFVVFIIFPAILLYKKNRFDLIFLLFLVFLISGVFSLILKFVIGRPRPDTNLIKTLSYSFPSSHAAVTFSVVPVVRSVSRSAGLFLVFLAIVVSITRIYLGVHYLSDVIFGALLGIYVGYLLRNVLWIEK